MYVRSPTLTRTGVVLPRAAGLMRTENFTTVLWPAATVSDRQREPANDSRLRADRVGNCAHTRSRLVAAVPVLRSRRPIVARLARRFTVTVRFTAAAERFASEAGAIGAGGAGAGAGVGNGPGSGGAAIVTVTVLVASRLPAPSTARLEMTCVPTPVGRMRAAGTGQRAP